MKKLVGIAVVVMLFLGSCASPKPYYETSEGKKKLKHYNKLQFGQDNHR
ncbi:MAG: hypothetical protein WAU36_10025 [Cyclobacteriaceae bacterium]